jgi:ABC-type lipoprotein export system ATPase subunit
MQKPLITCDNLVKIYKVADLEVVALQGLDLEVVSGEMIALVGHIWQQSGRNLLPELSIAVNVEMPQMLAGVGASQRTRRAAELLEYVGLKGMGRKKPDQLSGGKQQRVALARALVHKPRFIVADEPTGNLDTVTGRDIANLLRDIAHEAQVGLLVATHDATVVASSDRVLRINDGSIVDE